MSPQCHKDSFHNNVCTLPMNVAGPCFGEFHGIVEEAISNSLYTFITIEQIIIDTNLRYHDTMHVLADMKAYNMITIHEPNIIQFTEKMKRVKNSRETSKGT